MFSKVAAGHIRMERLMQYYRRFTDTETCDELFESLLTQQREGGITCPHCSSEYTVKHGRYKERQRYKCKDCARTFNDFTHTPLHWTHHPHKWIKYLECLLKGFSLRRSAIRVGLSWVTLFYWRHKIIHVLELLCLKNEATDDSDGRCGVIVPPSEHGANRSVSANSVLERMANLLSGTEWGQHWAQQLRRMNDKPQGINDKPQRINDKPPRVAPSTGTTYFMVRYRKTFPGIAASESHSFSDWIRNFDRIAHKYWHRYVAWFRFLQKLRGQSDIDAIKTLLTTTCCTRFEQTYISLRAPLSTDPHQFARSAATRSIG